MITRKIKVVFHNKNYKFEKHGNWIDLAVSSDMIMQPNERKKLDLGISMELPKFYEANILPRSGTFEKYGITMYNSMGIIDDTFKGNADRWKFAALAHKAGVFISKGDRIAQFKIVLSMNAPWYIKLLDLFTKIKFKEVSVLKGKDRGGFGSSGR